MTTPHSSGDDSRLSARLSVCSSYSYFTDAIEAILFDFSGTILDDLYAVYMGFVDLCEKHNKNPPTFSQFRKEFKLPYSEFLVEKGFADVQNAIRVWKAGYSDYEDSISLFPDVKPALEMLRELDNMKLGVISQTPEDLLERSLERFGIRGLFDKHGVIYDEWKPRPNGLVLAMKQIDVRRPNKVIYIGDTREDCLAARGAGVNPWAIYRENGSFHDLETLKQGQPVRIIKSLAELIPLRQPTQMLKAPVKAVV
jgi:HAD superfamily hydrolase (TIGR01549 family)